MRQSKAVADGTDYAGHEWAIVIRDLESGDLATDLDLEVLDDSTASPDLQFLLRDCATLLSQASYQLIGVIRDEGHRRGPQLAGQGDQPCAYYGVSNVAY